MALPKFWENMGNGTYINGRTREQKLNNDDNKYNLSLEVASGSEITPCNKIDKPLVVYRFPGTFMTSITTLHT